MDRGSAALNEYIVYKHTAPNGKAYIGMTKRSLQRRANYDGSGYSGCPAFYSAIQKYGWENIDHEILFTGLTKEEAEQKEIEMIAELGTNLPHQGYNLDNGGNTIGTHSQATREKMSRSLKGKGVGRKVSEATREKHRQALLKNNPQKGKPLTQAQKDALNAGRATGAKHHKARAVRCITTDTVYPTVKEAGEAVGVSYMSIIQSISEKHRRKHAGKIGDVPLAWEYYEKEKTTMAAKKTFKNTENPALQFISTPDLNENEERESAHVESGAVEAPSLRGFTPKLDKPETKSRRVQLLIKPSVYSAVKQIADASGLSVNEIINQILEDATRGE